MSARWQRAARPPEWVMKRVAAQIKLRVSALQLMRHNDDPVEREVEACSGLLINQLEAFAAHPGVRRGQEISALCVQMASTRIAAARRSHERRDQALSSGAQFMAARQLGAEVNDIVMREDNSKTLGVPQTAELVHWLLREHPEAGVLLFTAMNDVEHKLNDTIARAARRAGRPGIWALASGWHAAPEHLKAEEVRQAAELFTQTGQIADHWSQAAAPGVCGRPEATRSPWSQMTDPEARRLAGLEPLLSHSIEEAVPRQSALQRLSLPQLISRLQLISPEDQQRLATISSGLSRLPEAHDNLRQISWTPGQPLIAPGQVYSEEYTPYGTGVYHDRMRRHLQCIHRDWGYVHTPEGHWRYSPRAIPAPRLLAAWAAVDREAAVDWLANCPVTHSACELNEGQARLSAALYAAGCPEAEALAREVMTLARELRLQALGRQLISEEEL